MGLSLVSGSAGFAVAYPYVLCNSKEEEVLQGKNDYIAAFYQSGKVTCLGSLMEQVASAVLKAPAPLSVKIFSNLAGIIWLPFGLIAAAAKNNDYEKIAKHFNQSSIRLLPTRLSERSVQVLTFICENASKFIKIALLVGLVSLTYLGLYAYTAFFAATLLYHEIDNRGYLPRKVSLFFETYLPVLSSVLILLGGGSYLLQIFAAVQLATVFPPLNRLILQKVDKLSRYFFSLQGVPLEEYEAPLVGLQDPSFEEIEAILSSDDKDYEVNPAHCSKPVIGEFPKDKNFQKFLNFFREVPWEQRYAVIKGKLKDDENFCAFLKVKFPQELNPQKNFDTLVQQLAGDQSKEVYLANWIELQFNELLDVLEGRLRAKGEQKDVAEAIENSAIILAYLQRPEVDRVKREDLLLKLAAEGGSYCARGIKRATSEIVDETIIPDGLAPSEASLFDPLFDPQMNYEIKVRQALQNQRRSIIQHIYSLIVKILKIPGKVGNDVHGFDIYRKLLSIGFYPLSELERNELGLADIAVWSSYYTIQKDMLENYRAEIDEVVSKQGEVLFTDYMRRRLEEIQSLSDSQKDVLIEKWITANDGNWTVKETNRRFHRLMLVMLGILRKAESVAIPATA